MVESPVILLLFKLAYISMAASVLAFVIQYSRLAPWWNDAIGRSFVWKDLCIFGAAMLGIASLFFHFNRLTSNIAAILDLAILYGITAIMLWRTYLWPKIHRGKYIEKKLIRKFFKAIYLWTYYGKFTGLFRRGNRRREKTAQRD